MRVVSLVIAVTIVAALAPSGAAAKSAVSRAESKYAHQLAGERAKLPAPTAATSSIAKVATQAAR